MSRFLVIDSDALAEIVSGRDLQSADYEAGQTLAALLKGNINTAILSSAFEIITEDSH